MRNIRNRRSNNIRKVGRLIVGIFSFIYFLPLNGFSQTHEDSLKAFILTPPVADKPRINGPKVFGVRPSAPFIYHIPASGKRPMQFSITGLPKGLQLNKTTGDISGKISTKGTYLLRIKATNAFGLSERTLKVLVGDDICLTPPMGWNSWNCWASGVSQEKVMQSARGFVRNGLEQHGWSYINIDDGWQGAHDSTTLALQSNPKKFPSMKAMCDSIHSMGLKVGIYSTPWVRSYAGYLGGSAMNASGVKDSLFTKKVKANAHQLPWDCGTYSFAKQDAKQWADWGIDYLKYDWAPIDVNHTQEMTNALKATGRDIIYSLSNNGPHSIEKNIDSLAPLANLWRTDNDIDDRWKNVVRNGFMKEFWVNKQTPGHFNDPDMLVIGYVGWGKPHPSKLTPDEQISHISLWCLLSAPMLLGCDMDKMDDFTLSLITNDEVLDIDQDPLCKQAQKVLSKDSLDVFSKVLEDGSLAVGLFNRSAVASQVAAHWKDLAIVGKWKARNLWKQEDLGIFTDKIEATVASHGVFFVKLSKAE